MNWVSVLSMITKAMPKLLPSMLRNLADELEKNPALLDTLISQFGRPSA